MIGYALSAMLSLAAPDSATSAQALPSASPAPHLSQGNRDTLFLSPMGEPFRGQATRAAALNAWFAGADTDGNHGLSAQEVRNDAARFFATLDVARDQEIDPDDIRRYDSEIAPEVRMAGNKSRSGARYAIVPGGVGTDDSARGGGGRGESGQISGSAKRIPSTPEVGLKGAGRWGLLNIPHPISSADTNFNRGISIAEFQQAATARFVLLDSNRDGKLSLDELQTQLATLPTDRSGR